MRLAEQALKEKQSHLVYQETLQEPELEERERNVMERPLKEPHFPEVKTPEELNFEVTPHLPATGLRKSGKGHYSEETERLVWFGKQTRHMLACANSHWQTICFVGYRGE